MPHADTLPGFPPHLRVLAADDQGPKPGDRPPTVYTIHVIDRTACYLPYNWLQRPALPLRGFAGG